jgi:hypothetical protein
MKVKRVGGRIARRLRICKFCGEAFTPQRSNQVHCCPEHRNREAQRVWRERAQAAMQAQEAVNVG